MTVDFDPWAAQFPGATATMNVTYTQANAAGGAVVCEISPGAGNEFIISAAQCKNSGTNTAIMELLTATGGTVIATYASVGSGAGTFAHMYPVTTTGSTSASGQLPGYAGALMVSGTQAFRLRQSGAGAQNDTFQVLINIRVRGAMPTVTHANSTNAANVSATAGAESFTTV